MLSSWKLSDVLSRVDGETQKNLLRYSIVYPTTKSMLNIYNYPYCRLHTRQDRLDYDKVMWIVQRYMFDGGYEGSANDVIMILKVLQQIDDDELALSLYDNIFITRDGFILLRIELNGDAGTRTSAHIDMNDYRQRLQPFALTSSNTSPTWKIKAVHALSLLVAVGSAYFLQISLSEQ